MGRWIVNILAGVSALLFVAIVVLWVRSYWAVDELAFLTPGGRELRSVWTAAGRVNCLRMVLVGGEEGEAFSIKGPAEGLHYKTWRPPKDALTDLDSRSGYRVFRWPGIRICLHPPDGKQIPLRIFQMIIVSAWWLLLPCLPFPWLWLRRTRRERRLAWRKKHGLCLVCGYDLRATPDRCPECGTAPMTKSETGMTNQ